MRLVGVVGSYGYVCMEVYRFPHNYLSPLLLLYSYICSFLQQHPYFLSGVLKISLAGANNSVPTTGLTPCIIIVHVVIYM